MAGWSGNLGVNYLSYAWYDIIKICSIMIKWRAQHLLRSTGAKQYLLPSLTHHSYLIISIIALSADKKTERLVALGMGAWNDRLTDDKL
jgi:hypothetical protein